jgi:hypothetical protein
MPSPSYPLSDLYKSQIPRLCNLISCLRRQPIAGSSPQLKNRGCENLLPDQGHSSPQGVAIGQYGAMVEWWLGRKNQKILGEKPVPVTLCTWRHVALNPRLCVENWLLNHVSYAIWVAHWLNDICVRLFPNDELLMSSLSLLTSSVADYKHPEIFNSTGKWVIVSLRIGPRITHANSWCFVCEYDNNWTK